MSGSGSFPLPIPFRDPVLAEIWSRIDSGGRLDAAEGLALFTTSDLPGLGWMARTVRRRLHGDAVTYVRNQVVNPSNVCLLRCGFCRFSVDAGDERAYDLEPWEIARMLPPDVREVHVVGGLHPHRGWDYYLEVVALIRERLPGATIKAWTAVEIIHFARRFGINETEVLSRLREAGLDMLPGGGAEIFAPRVRRLLCPEKPDAEQWLAVHRTAHGLGIQSNATMLYGHLETAEERVEHLIRLRALQDETRGFRSFIPLPFQPGGSEIVDRRTPPTDDLKTIAAARLILDNIPNIKAYWVMTGETIAATAQHFGANDMEGTLGGEKIAHAAAAGTPASLSPKRMDRLITAAGWTPVERDGRHRVVQVKTAEPVLGMIPFLNSEPFHWNLHLDSFRIIPMAPRRMGQLAREGTVDAGLLSLMDYFDLEDTFDPLDYGIAVRDRARSVFLLSARDPKHLNGRHIGVTEETSTSVCLMRLILKQKFGCAPLLERMITDRQGQRMLSRFDAVLLIGDRALLNADHFGSHFPHRMDLAQAWHEMTGLPFVFARWSVRRSLDPGLRQDLARGLDQALRRYEAAGPRAAGRHGRRLGLQPQEVARYLGGFNYRFGEAEATAIHRFRTMYGEAFDDEGPRP
jgi:aminodeoxyfutalosine synthase